METKLKLYKSLERMYIYRDRETKRDFVCVYIYIYISKDLYNFSFFSSLLLVLLSSLPSFSSWSSSFLYPFFLSLFSRFSFSSFFLFLLTSFSSPLFSYSFISFSTFSFIFLSSFFSFFGLAPNSACRLSS